MSNDHKISKCAGCGGELPRNGTSELCPRCLLAAGLNTQEGPEGTVIVPNPASAATKGLPQPGELFGHYQLVRLLGQGGMGVVYEAEDLDSGRRVALKILGQALDSPESRKRFLREGQLAASINHPNSVYVYGTEEIAGTPVISMELVAGGTLRDRVTASGPMPASEAVDCILQIIAGLEAAQRIGILHRDVKPSNCFIDADGTVKIGDFGLSITTAVRTESNITASGALFGTPAFSSPEQLRGEELTARSDIYAVGVTLYFLLTGRTPFEAPNVVQLLATVLERRAESPAKLRADIPQGVCRAVLRCLEKDAGQRYPDYGALRDALLPYAPGSPTPATLGLRFIAGCIDHVILAVPETLISLAIYGGWAAMNSPEVNSKTLWSMGCGSLIVLLYYGLLEGIGGATLGKALCRLRVVRSDRNPPGVWRAMARALVFFGLPAIPQVILTLNHDWMLQHLGDLKLNLLSLLAVVIQILIFSTVRRSNGFAAIHDLLSQTRVIVRSTPLRRPVLTLGPETVPNIEATPQKGPYFVLEPLGASGSAELSLAYDARLLRKVWIRTQPAGAPPVSSELRNLARAGRLRWINGSRSSTESWDAYEASAGRPLLQLAAEKQDWDCVRFWLLDLAEEINASQQLHEPLPALGLDRIWITSEGRAKLLDFPAPNTRATADGTLPPTAPEFLRQVALSALEGRAVGLEEARRGSPAVLISMHARGFIDNLTSAVSMAEIISWLRLLLDKPSAVTRLRRVAMLALTMLFPIFTLCLVWLGTIFGETPSTGVKPLGTPDAQLRILALVSYSCLILYVVIPSVLAALFFRGGLVMRGLGVAVVNRRGAESRWRASWRALVSWLPFLLVPIAVHALEPALGVKKAALTALGFLGLLTLLSLILKRSLQDRLAGSYLVPRAPAPEIVGTFEGKGVARVIGLLLILGAVFVYSQYSRNKNNAQPEKPAAIETSPAIERVVLQPDGSPAPDAQIWVCSPIPAGTEGTLHCYTPGK